MTASTLRDVSRDAVRGRIAEVADRLFAVNGFDQTTVDQIAAEVGMSQRTFFRYFASKEAAALHEVDAVHAELLARLDARPVGEPYWDTLRRLFDCVLDRYEEVGARTTRDLLTVLVSSPSLMAAYLERGVTMQARLVEAMRARARSAGAPVVDELMLTALVGSAFACLDAVTMRPAGAPDPSRVAASLDALMAVMRPTGFPGAAASAGHGDDVPRAGRS